MSITITSDNKNTVTLTNDVKGPNPTWDEATYTWDEAVGTWDKPGTVISKDTKNTVSLNLDVKS